MLHPLNMPTPMLNAKSIASPLFFINRFLSFLLFIYTGIIKDYVCLEGILVKTDGFPV